MGKKFKILKVTVEQMYLIPMLDNERSEINGWTLDQIKEDWFVRHNINSPHATRHAYEIGYSKKVLHVEEHHDMKLEALNQEETE